jgi:hypothetical protein
MTNERTPEQLFLFLNNKYGRKNLHMKKKNSLEGKEGCRPIIYLLCTERSR